MIAIASRLYGNLKHGFGYLPIVLAVVCALMSAPALMAAEQEALLEVEPAEGSAVDYDLTRLDSLPQVVITTSTIWTVGKIRFSGPTLKQVLADAGIRHGAIRLSALNDYVIDMTVEEFREWEHDKEHSIVGYRNKAFKSPCTGTMAPVHHTPWLDALDDSMKAFLATKQAAAE